MTINTFEFSKGIIIVIVYNMIILTSIKCNDNLTVPDYDTKLIVNGNTSYFDYHFRSAQNPGQLKISPIGYFSSIYNCPYTVLPEVGLGCGGYTEYILKLNELSKFLYILD
ncbi:uncharacterized protein LOC132920976 [Rhopalosiphum padi]|uniref:uncharacterized protein LOC132920976 n=1 Tax=Rhopalosiphum padi TaxID=40932 RepID=UPI00298E0FE9|nr:uncharacterized protein LOC132920976 [Rhopalosiphum padi]